LSAALLSGGCSSLNLPDLRPAPSESAVERYGPYCEQLGNLKGTPEFDACVKKQQGIYK
jgi:hypothetical protein